MLKLKTKLSKRLKADDLPEYVETECRPLQLKTHHLHQASMIK